jgi:hypothetical protein
VYNKNINKNEKLQGNMTHEKKKNPSVERNLEITDDEISRKIL